MIAASAQRLLRAYVMLIMLIGVAAGLSGCRKDTEAAILRCREQVGVSPSASYSQWKKPASAPAFMNCVNAAGYDFRPGSSAYCPTLEQDTQRLSELQRTDVVHLRFNIAIFSWRCYRPRSAIERIGNFFEPGPTDFP